MGTPPSLSQSLIKETYSWLKQDQSELKDCHVDLLLEIRRREKEKMYIFFLLRLQAKLLRLLSGCLCHKGRCLPESEIYTGENPSVRWGEMKSWWQWMRTEMAREFNATSWVPHSWALLNWILSIVILKSWIAYRMVTGLFWGTVFAHHLQRIWDKLRKLGLTYIHHYIYIK